MDEGQSSLIYDLSDLECSDLLLPIFQRYPLFLLVGISLHWISKEILIKYSLHSKKP